VLLVLGYTVEILSNRDDSPRVIANKIREWLVPHERQ